MSKSKHIIRLPLALHRSRILHRLLADQQGVAALEFALLLPLLSAMALATTDFSLLASRTYQAQSLAQSLANAIAGLPAIPSASSGPLLQTARNFPSAGKITNEAGVPRRAVRNAADNSSLPEHRQLSRLQGASPSEFAAGVAYKRSPLPDLPRIRIDDLVTLPEDASATSRLFWGCSIKSVLTTASEATCPDGSRPAAYAEVVVRAAVNRLLAWPESLVSATVEGRAVVRLG